MHCQQDDTPNVLHVGANRRDEDSAESAPNHAAALLLLQADDSHSEAFHRITRHEVYALLGW